MPLSEFELIKHYFQAQQDQAGEIVCGIGDDAAIVTLPPAKQLAVAIDTLVAGVHFPLATPAYDIGWKALAVNLSDMAAMGARPAWFTLALTLPETDPQWLEEFSSGLFQLAKQYHVSLIGGDTTRGELTISIQIAGFVDPGQAILRQGAKSGDLIYVTGHIGDAWLGLNVLQKKIAVSDEQRDWFVSRLNRPPPRIDEALALQGIAHCAIDISDGLLADLRHLMQASDCGAEVFVEQVPLSIHARKVLQQHPELLPPILAGGDDYELCFCIAAENRELLESIASKQGFSFTQIGRVTDELGITCLDHNNQPLSIPITGYDHFSKDKE